jgi:TfoX/Sxy family transcriptional regulator of competence genes
MNSLLNCERMLFAEREKEAEMAFNETLADRIRKKLRKRTGVAEKRMFGGLAFLLNGNMSVGIHGEELIVRVHPAETDAALAEPHTRVFDLTGRPMKGWILVATPGLSDEKTLGKWIRRGTDYAASLPAK